MNKYASHIYLIPEDDADRQIAIGFVEHPQVNDARIRVVPPPGGWPKVLSTFSEEYVRILRNYPCCHVVMLIDFDGQVGQRMAYFQQQIPQDIAARVFVVGSEHTPEQLKNALNLSFEEIGISLANDCAAGNTQYWSHAQLQHNASEHQRLIQAVKSFLF